jgi:hypothetical protein
LSIDNFVKLAEAINLKISFISAYTEEEDQKNYYSFSKKVLFPHLYETIDL